MLEAGRPEISIALVSQDYILVQRTWPINSSTGLRSQNDVQPSVNDGLDTIQLSEESVMMQLWKSELQRESPWNGVSAYQTIPCTHTTNQAPESKDGKAQNQH